MWEFEKDKAIVCQRFVLYKITDRAWFLFNQSQSA